MGLCQVLSLNCIGQLHTIRWHLSDILGVVQKHLSGLQIRVRNWKWFFLFLNQNICCGYSKELSQWDSSFEHPKHMFKMRGKKIITIFLRSKILLNWTYDLLSTYESRLPYSLTEFQLRLNTARLRNFSCFCCQFFSKYKLFQKIFNHHYHSGKWLDSDQDWHSVRPNLGPNCLQRISAEDTSSRQWCKVSEYWG